MGKLSGGLSDNEKVFVEALAGAIGGFAGAVAFYPLDTIKTRIQAVVEKEGVPRQTWMQVFNKLVETEGVSALFAGVGAKGAHSWISSFIYFLAFSSLKRSWEARTGQKIGLGANLVVAAVAGCCNVLVAEPLDTLSTRRQIVGAGGTVRSSDGCPLDGPISEAGAGAKAGAKAGDVAWPEKEGGGEISIDQETGADRMTASIEDTSWGSLYSGIGASLLLTINPAIQYTCYEQMRQRVISSLSTRAVRRGKKPVVELSVGDAFVLGATSKAIATFLTYPLVRAKVLAKTPGGALKGMSLPTTMRTIARLEGTSGLYKGLQAQLLKTVLASAFTLTVKEKSFRTAMLLVLLVNRL